VRTVRPFRQQQLLRRRQVALFEPVQHLLEQDPLVRRVLIQEHQTAVRFEHDVEPADHSHQAKRDVEQGNRIRGRSTQVRRRNPDGGRWKCGAWAGEGEPGSVGAGAGDDLNPMGSGGCEAASAVARVNAGGKSGNAPCSAGAGDGRGVGGENPVSGCGSRASGFGLPPWGCRPP